MKIEKEQIKLAYSRLPENIQQVFDAEETALALMAMGKKYGLHIDQIGQLTTIVHYVLLGLLPQRDFIKEIKNSVGVSEDIANLITYDFNQQILSKIRKELEELSPMTDASVKPKTEEQKPKVVQIFDEKMKTIANDPRQEVAVTPSTGDNNKVRDPYRESPI